MNLPIVPARDDDVASVKQWFAGMVACSLVPDYEAAAAMLLSEHYSGFGAGVDPGLYRSAQETAQRQWMRVWPNIKSAQMAVLEDREFEIVTSADRLWAICATTGALKGGTLPEKMQRHGARTTIVLVREDVSAPWLAAHQHYSIETANPDHPVGSESGAAMVRSDEAEADA